MEKNALRFIKDSNDFQALANIHVEAESPCGVSTVRIENLMIQTQTAMACDIIKKKLSMVNEMTNTRTSKKVDVAKRRYRAPSQSKPME